jgi:GT2 family glycosyltransferase
LPARQAFHRAHAYGIEELAMPRVAINIVTWNSKDYIQTCLDAALKQTYQDLLITVLDNDSSDGTISCLAPYLDAGVGLIPNSRNDGYAAAHNKLIRATDSDYVLTLNPDVRLRPNFVEQLVTALENSPQYGSASGQLLSVPSQQFREIDLANDYPFRIDEAGMGIYKSRRQYMRGYKKPVGESCAEFASIFGPGGAAAFYRRAMLEDVCINDEYFDESFFVHKEDVDLAWRAQLLGWDCCYVPLAVGYHVRGFHPGKRKRMSVEIRRHAIKNRWLMAVKNERTREFLLDTPHILLYDIQILGYMLLFERDSLPAFIDFMKLLPRAMQWRRLIHHRGRGRTNYMSRWLGHTHE